MRRGVTLLAPAKLNLGLRLIDRRPDGYHEIETVFLPISLYDRIRIEPREDPGVTLVAPGLPPGVPSDETNLAVRAALEMQRRGAAPPGLCLRLEKHIPAAAGLGGGSSDAAAVVLGLEALAGEGLDPGERLALARGLGADVPFFLAPRPAVGRGIGDRIEPLPDVPPMWWILAVFPFGVSTAEAYAAASLELTLPGGGSSIAPLLGPSGIRASPPNDLEGIATRLHPEVAEARRALEGVGARPTGMSGSGPTVYGRFESLDKAVQAARSVGLPGGARALVACSPGSDTRDWRWGVAKW